MRRASCAPPAMNRWWISSLARKAIGFTVAGVMMSSSRPGVMDAMRFSELVRERIEMQLMYR